LYWQPDDNWTNISRKITTASQLNHITIDDGSRNEIQNALANGLEVTVHQSPISVNGRTGSGYAILDADCGVGAYKISGGASGGTLILLGFVALAILAISGFAFGLISGLIGLVSVYFQLVGYLSFLEELAFEVDADKRVDELNSRIVTMIFAAITGCGFAKVFQYKTTTLSEQATKLWRSIAMAAYAVLGQL